MSSTAVVVREYEGIPVFFQGDAYINATAAAKHFGKKAEGWIKTDRTKEYVRACAKKFALDENQLVITRFGSPENGGGTWIHPKLAIDFARWLDADFAVWCDEQIEAILKGEKLPTIEPGLGSQALRIIADEIDALRGEVVSIRHGLHRQSAEIAQLRLRGAARHRPTPANANQVGLDLDPQPKAKGEAKGGTHASPAPHARRGHYRALSEGRKVWVRETFISGGKGEDRS